MELAEISPNGQVTIPISIRKRLNLKGGDQLLFLERDGQVVITSPEAGKKL